VNERSDVCRWEWDVHGDNGCGCCDECPECACSEDRVQHIDALRLRNVLGRNAWSAPTEFGPAGWSLRTNDSVVIVTCAEDDDGIDWRHASMSRPSGVPTYEDLTLLHRAAFPEGGWSYQVFAPPTNHINIHPRTLHLWGHCDGSPALQDFGARGTI
jgi:hypothetical protein